MDPREAAASGGGAAPSIQKYSTLLYVTASGGSSKPIDMREAAALLTAGTLQDATLVWTEGMAQWTPLGQCRERFQWPSQQPGWTEAHTALVEKKVAELRQAWDSLPDDDLLALLDELPEDEAEAQWGKAYEKLMAADARLPEGVPPAGWGTEAQAKIEEKVARFGCGWDGLPDDDLLDLLDELEPLGKTEDEIGSYWDSVWTKLRATKAKNAPAPAPQAVDFKSIVGLSSPAPAPAPSSAGWSAEELSLVAERAAQIGVPYESLTDDDLLDVLDLFDGKDEADVQKQWDSALAESRAAAPAAAVPVSLAAADSAGAPSRTDSAAALEELEAMSPLATRQSTPIEATSPAVAAVVETKLPPRSLECKGYNGGYKGEPETQMVAWIEEVTAKSLGSDWVASLKDGVILCELCNALEPQSVKRINRSSKPFPQRENLQAAINAMRKFGVADKDNFDTADLHEQKNTRQVQIALLALGRAAYSVPGYEGPCVGKKPVARASGKKHGEVKIDGLWGKAGGAAPKAGYTRAVGEVDTSTSIRPSENANKARFKRNSSKGTTANDSSDPATADGGGGGGGGDGDDDDEEMDFGDLDDLIDSSPVARDQADEAAAAARAEAVREAAALEELKKQMAVEQERLAAMEQQAADIKRAAEAEAKAIREAAAEQARQEAERIAAAEKAAADAAEKAAADAAEKAAADAAEKAAGAAKLKAAAEARAQKKQAAAGERPPPNPDWVRPASAPPTGPYPGNYNLDAPMDELACAWVSEVSGLTAGSLDDLRDGVTLCELCNVLVPGAVKRINRSAMPFPQVRLTRNGHITGRRSQHSFVRASLRH